jgi:hypothetical protein
MKSLLLAGLTIVLLLTADVLAVSTVRGKLYRQANGRSYGASGVGVRLVDPQGTARTASSASDGLFYFYNVPAGSYTLEVYIGPQPQSYWIQVEERAYTDIAPIEVP